MTASSPPPAKSVAQRQAALRARRASRGLKQLVLYADPEDFDAIRAHADKLTAKRGKGTKP